VENNTGDICEIDRFHKEMGYTVIEFRALLRTPDLSFTKKLVAVISEHRKYLQRDGSSWL
jgi:hypothetical protein